MENEVRKNYNINTGWGGFALTIAIIVVRAFQNGAEPMSQWSAASWLLMTLPVTWPVALMVLWGVGYVAFAMFGALFCRRKRRM